MRARLTIELSMPSAGFGLSNPLRPKILFGMLIVGVKMIWMIGMFYTTTATAFDPKSGAIFLQRNKLVGIEKFAHVDTPFRISDGELSSVDGTTIEYDDADWLFDGRELGCH